MSDATPLDPDRMVEGKSIVVTGAGGGIGRAIALALARQGARIVVNDLGASLQGKIENATAADDVVAEIRAFGGEAVASTDSVSGWSSAEKIVQCALDSFGRIDGVMNNAGILRDRMFHKMSEDEWRQVIDVHLNGTFFVSRAAAPHMRAQGSGAFVHTTSNAGLVGSIGQANYSAAKMAIVGLSQSIALEMGRAGVRSNCIAPTAWSRMISSVPTDTPEQAVWADKLKKMTPEKIAPLAVYLLSDAASGVNGQIFGVRRNEILLYGQMRPVRSVHTSDGWTPASIAETAEPSFRQAFTPLDTAVTYFTWDPI